MSRKPVRRPTDKLIHIRIDEETHRRLKIEAASSETTVQQIVESLLKKKLSSKRK
jgi:predicted HicB family RNase H-like nuclease